MTPTDRILIRAARPADHVATGALLRSAFGKPHGRDVIEMVTALDRFGATRASLVATFEDNVIGHVQLSRGWIDARRELVEVLVLSPLSVLPEHHNCGVGSRLLTAALREAERQRSPAVFLEGDWRYYRSRGFTAAAEHGFVRPSDRITEPAFQVSVLPSHQTWMSGRLIYPEAFWSTDTVGLRDPQLSEVEARGG